MIALLVISYPLEILNIFWNAIENDGRKNDSRNTENEIDRKLDDLCVKVQNSLDDSQQKIVESVRDIDEKISKVTSDTPCMSFRRTDSMYEFKVVIDVKITGNKRCASLMRRAPTCRPHYLGLSIPTECLQSYSLDETSGCTFAHSATYRAIIIPPR